MREPSLGEGVNRAARLLRRLADARLSRFGLSSGYLPIVTALMRDDGLAQKDLVLRAGIEQPTMVNTLARMERDGIIERRPDPADRRSSLFSLTPPVKARVPEIRAAIESLGDEASAGLTPDETAVLKAALATIAATVEAALLET